MRSISIRQFQQNFYKELASLPFEVTRRGRVVFHVTTFEVQKDVTASNVTTLNTKEEVKKVLEKKSSFNICKHGSMVGLCRFGCER